MVPKVVKVAPGTYNEVITMAPFVDVEGTGIDATTIASIACEGSSASFATVTLAGYAQIRGVTISNFGTTGSHCSGAYVPPSANQTKALMLDAVIYVENPLQTPGVANSGMRIESGVSLLSLKNVEIRVQNGYPSYGVVWNSPNSGSVLLRDTVIEVSGLSGSFGVRMNGNDATLGTDFGFRRGTGSRE